MSLDMDEFLRDVKQAAAEVGETKKPFALLFGTVTSAEPDLKIFVNQKLTLDEQQIVLTNNVRDYTVYMSTAEDHYTENEQDVTAVPEDYGMFRSHKHTYKGKKKWTVHMALKVGEKVILLRCDGGQKYIVLDRVEAPDE